MKKNLYLILLLLFGFFELASQDCQLVSLNLPIPAGVSKHHFPIQEMPATSPEEAFVFLTKWNTGNLTLRIRFSEDGEEWTKWEVLKRNFDEPEALRSPFHTVDGQYSFFEWAVYNNEGIESELSLSFYYPDEVIFYADLPDTYELEVSSVGCPVPSSSQPIAPVTVVSSQQKD